MADDSEVSLPKSTLQKSIKDLLPPDMRVAGDAVDLLVQCCNEFVHLVSTQANEVSEADKRNTISPEHVLRALEQLGFTAYVGGVSGAWEEWKGEKKEHQKLVSKKSAALDSGLTQEQLVELQRRLFEEARARTLSAAPPLPPPPQQQQQQQQEQQPAAAAAATQVEAAGLPAAAPAGEQQQWPPGQPSVEQLGGEQQPQQQQQRQQQQPEEQQQQQQPEAAQAEQG